MIYCDREIDLAALAAHAGHLLDAAGLLGIILDLWEAQNHVLDTFSQMNAASPLSAPLRQAFGQLADRLYISQDLLGWRP
jgi:hypothetical protein